MHIAAGSGSFFFFFPWIDSDWFVDGLWATYDRFWGRYWWIVGCCSLLLFWNISGGTMFANVFLELQTKFKVLTNLPRSAKTKQDKPNKLASISNARTSMQNVSPYYGTLRHTTFRTSSVQISFIETTAWSNNWKLVSAQEVTHRHRVV